MTTRSHQYNRNAGTFEEFSQDMERVFDSLLGRTVGTILRPTSEPKFSPSLDVVEQADAFLVSVDLPGIDPEQVKVEMHEGKLSISGKRENLAQSGEGKTYHRVERITGDFAREHLLICFYIFSSFKPFHPDLLLLHFCHFLYYHYYYYYYC